MAANFAPLPSLAQAVRTSQPVPLSHIIPDPDQPRKHFVDIEEFAERLRREGLLTPITLTEQETGSHLIFYGERRFRAFLVNQQWAASLLESGEELPVDHPALLYDCWTQIPAFLEPAPDPVNRLLIQIAENTRDELSLFETASAFTLAASRAKAGGMSNGDFAKRAGLLPSTLSNYKAVTKASGNAKLALERGYLRDTVALHAYQQLPNEDQEALFSQAEATEGVITRKMCTDQLAAIEAARNKEAAAAAAKKPTTKKTGDPQAGSSEPSPESPTLSLTALGYLHELLERSRAEDELSEALRLEALGAVTRALLQESPLIAIVESEWRSSSSEATKDLERNQSEAA